MGNLLDSVILFFVKSLNAQLSFRQEILCVLRFSPDLIGHGLIMSRAQSDALGVHGLIGVDGFGREANY
jgi:hypothetical protein